MLPGRDMNQDQSLPCAFPEQVSVQGKNYAIKDSQ